MEIYRGRLVAYSLGNFSGFHNFTLEGVRGETVVADLSAQDLGSPAVEVSSDGRITAP